MELTEFVKFLYAFAIILIILAVLGGIIWLILAFLGIVFSGIGVLASAIGSVLYILFAAVAGTCLLIYKMTEYAYKSMCWIYNKFV